MTLLSRPVLKLVAAVVLTLVAVTNIVLVCLVFSWISTANPLPNESLSNDDTSTVFYDSQGNEVVRLSAKENRLWVPYAEIPDNLKKAFVAIEDERFWTHSGIDPQRIAGAVFGMITGHQGAGGGSTITQQLVKNLSGRWEPTLKRKVQEQWAALDLERRLSKEKILELYLNVIYLGNGAYGVQAASRGYFGKDVGDLNLAECAFVAGLTKNPARYGTLVPAALARQKTVLTRMRDQKMISPDDFKDALKFPISYTGTDVQKRVSTYSWFVDAAIEDILTDLNSTYGWSEQVAQNKLFNGGLKIYLTMDPRVQKPLDDVFTRKLDNGSLEFFPRQGRGEIPQGAMVVMDPKNGHILGLTGGAGLKSQSRELNRATQTLRQPGSAIKPIGVYAPAIERSLITEATAVDDAPIHFPGAEGTTWDPQNFDKTFHGMTTIREAIAESDNIVAVKTLLQVGIDVSMDFLKNLGISTLVPEDRQAALALGGLTRGVTVREMTGAYGALANGGQYRTPVTYLKVEDHDGRVLLETKEDPQSIMEETTAFLVTDMMTEVLKSGTAKGYAIQGGRIATAGKSGTTQDVKDKWFVGYTPYLLGVCWYGYDRPRSFPAEQQPIRIWSAVMEAAHKNMGYGRAQFPEPAGIVHAQACIDSGMKPTDRCALDPRSANGGPSRIQTFAFKAGTEPTEECTVHGPPRKVDVRTSCLAEADCPDQFVVLRSFLRKPDPWQDPLPGDPRTADSVYEEKYQVVSPVH